MKCDLLLLLANSHNGIPRVAQRYGTMAFVGLIRRTPPTFSDTSVTDRHSDTTIFQLRACLVWIFWSVGSEKSFGHALPVGVEPLTSCVNGTHPID